MEDQGGGHEDSEKLLDIHWSTASGYPVSSDLQNNSHVPRFSRDVVSGRARHPVVFETFPCSFIIQMTIDSLAREGNNNGKTASLLMYSDENF